MSDAKAPPNAAPGVPVRPEVPAWKLVLTLAVAGALSGLLLVFVDQATSGPIRAHRRAALESAVREVLKDPVRVESYRVTPDGLVREDVVEYEVDAGTIDRVFLGFRDAAGTEPVGFAITYEKAGFQDKVRVIFGYDPRTRTVLGMKVLESKETPGLGDKIEKDAAFVDQFGGRTAPIKAVKPGKGTGAPEEIDTITGATISSVCVVDVINAALARTAAQLERWAEEEGR